MKGDAGLESVREVAAGPIRPTFGHRRCGDVCEFVNRVERAGCPDKGIWLGVK
jgi:hypothetical protein